MSHKGRENSIDCGFPIDILSAVDWTAIRKEKTTDEVKKRKLLAVNGTSTTMVVKRRKQRKFIKVRQDVAVHRPPMGQQ